MANRPQPVVKGKPSVPMLEGHPAGPVLTVCDVTNNELRVAWWQPPSAAEPTEWLVEWRAPNWWRPRRQRIRLPALAEFITALEPAELSLIVRVQAFSGRRASEWSRTGRAIRGPVVAATLGLCSDGGSASVRLRLSLVSAGAAVNGGACNTVDAATAAGGAGPGVGSSGDAATHVAALSLQVAAGSNPARVRVSVRPSSAAPLPPPPPPPAATEVLVTLTAEEVVRSIQLASRAASSSGGPSDAMLAFISPTLDDETHEREPGEEEAWRGGTRVRVRVGLALVRRREGEARPVPPSGIASGALVGLNPAAGGAALVGLVNGMVLGLKGGFAGGVHGLRDGVVGGVQSLGELATTAASWVRDFLSRQIYFEGFTEFISWVIRGNFRAGLTPPLG